MSLQGQNWETGNYEGVMNILQKTPDVKKLLSMREYLMNIPALMHVVMGARITHTEDPFLLVEKEELEKVLDAKCDHIKILERLIELGADLSVKNIAGKPFSANVSPAIAT